MLRRPRHLRAYEVAHLEQGVEEGAVAGREARAQAPAGSSASTAS